MKASKSIHEKLLDFPTLLKKIAQWRILGKSIVFTNGCFDLLHSGHIASLLEASKQGDFLIVGVNSDASIKKIKRPGRPINNENSRALILASLAMVDAVVIFSEETPVELIKGLEPDVLVKGGDYTIDEIAGANEVMKKGGKVIINPIVEGFSTTTMIDKIKKLP